MDPEDVLKASDRIAGHVGKLAQRQAQQDRNTERLVEAAKRRREALQTQDPDAALRVLTEQEQRDREYLEAHEAEQTRSHWEEAVEYFTSKAPAAVRQKLADKEYGTDPLRASVAFWRDLAQETVAHLPELEKTLEARIEKRLTPQIEKRLRAELLGEEPSPDLGGGAGSNGSHRFTRADIARMSPAEYERNRDAIQRQLAARRSGAA